MKFSKWGWFVPESQRVEVHSLILTVRIRKWHPGYWFHALKGIIRRRWRYHVKPFFVDREWMKR